MVPIWGDFGQGEYWLREKSLYSVKFQMVPGIRYLRTPGLVQPSGTFVLHKLLFPYSLIPDPHYGVPVLHLCVLFHPLAC